MRHSAILVFANKQDLKNALSPAETCEAMGLPQMKGRKWHVQVRCGAAWRVNRQAAWPCVRSRGRDSGPLIWLPHRAGSSKTPPLAWRGAYGTCASAVG
jgi:hypothetical protein